MHILIISLPDSNDRRAAMQAQMAGHTGPWSFLDATRVVDGQVVPQYDNAKCLRHFCYPLRAGEIGCFISHRLAWQRCISLGQPLLILEDDAEFLQPVADVLLMAEQALTYCDLARLAGLFPREYRFLNKPDLPELARHLRDPVGAAAYVLTPRVAQILVDKSKRFHEPVDLFMATEEWRHGHGMLSLMPFPIRAALVESTIGVRSKPDFPVAVKIKRELFKTPNAIARSLFRNYLNRKSWPKKFSPLAR